MKKSIFVVILSLFCVNSYGIEPKIGRIDRPGHINTTSKSLKQLQKEWKKEPLKASKCEPYNKVKLECQKRTAIHQLSTSYKMHQMQK